MENATKALLIAATVLVAILIISLGIYIVTSSGETIDSSRNSMTELEIKTFNQRFTSFEGKRKSNAQVLQLLKTIQSSNSSNDNQIAVKLVGLGQVVDTHSYAIVDENNNLEKCNVGNIMSLDEIINKVKNNRAYNYKVELYYCNQKTAYYSNNKALKPMAGCIILVMISKN